MSKFKLFLVLLLLGYGGYFAWKHFVSDRDGGSLSRRPTRKSSILVPSVGGEDGSNDVPELPSLLQHHQDLRTVSNLLFAQLNSVDSSQVPNLQRVWAAAESDFKAGVISERDAQVLADIIRQLNLMDKDRLLYLQRFRELDLIKLSDFDKGMSIQQKRAFAEKELNRQWRDWVKVNRDKLKPLFSALSE